MKNAPRGTAESTDAVPVFRPASELIRELPKPPAPPRPPVDVAHEDADATATPEAGRPWAPGQLAVDAECLCTPEAVFSNEDAMNNDDIHIM